MTGDDENPIDYNVKGLKDAIDETEPIDTITVPEPTHECQVCSWKEHIDDHQRRTPAWCDMCKEVQTFRRLE